jgi:hypothetical protein
MYSLFNPDLQMPGRVVEATVLRPAENLGQVAPRFSAGRDQSRNRGLGTKDADLAGRNLGPRLNRQLSKRGSLRLVRYAAMARASIGPGSHGSGIKGAIRTILSDPQRPHRCRAEDETIVQFSQ